jgi:hypothetical protein
VKSHWDSQHSSVLIWIRGGDTSQIYLRGACMSEMDMPPHGVTIMHMEIPPHLVALEAPLGLLEGCDGDNPPEAPSLEPLFGSAAKGDHGSET